MKLCVMLMSDDSSLLETFPRTSAIVVLRSAFYINYRRSTLILMKLNCTFMKSSHGKRAATKRYQPLQNEMLNTRKYFCRTRTKYVQYTYMYARFNHFWSRREEGGKEETKKEQKERETENES